MGQPTPPGDMPLFEGLGTEWNDVVSAIPEDRRAELAPRIKERLSAYEPLKQWEDFQRSGITPAFAGQALDVFKYIEDNPREVYKAIGDHLGLTPAEAKEAVKELEKENKETGEDPRFATLQQQVETLAQIALAQRQQSTQEQEIAKQDAAMQKEMDSLKNKYGDDVDEEEILMRMLHKNMTAQQAYEEYSGKVTELRKRHPAPMLLGAGGTVPKKGIDVTKLNPAETKNLVAEMLAHENQARNS